MSFVDDLIARGEARPRRVIEFDHKGTQLRFKVPYGGVERVTLRRRCEAWVKEQTERPNAGWVASGLIPAGGFPKEEASAIFHLHYLSDPQWSQEDVLRMFNANPDEVEMIAANLLIALNEQMQADAQQEADEKKEPLTSTD